jgi:hypothetical protein
LTLKDRADHDGRQIVELVFQLRDHGSQIDATPFSGIRS